MDLKEMQKAVYRNGVELAEEIERKMEINRRRKYATNDGVLTRLPEE